MKLKPKIRWLIAIKVILLLTLISFNSKGQSPNLYTPFPATKLLYVKWDAFPQAVRYKLYWSNSHITDTALCTRVDITTNGQIYYIHSGLTGNLDYYYIIFAIDNVGGSTLASNEVVGAPLPDYFYYNGGDGDGHSKSGTCVIKPDGSYATPNSQNITVYSGVGENYIFWPQEAGTNDYTLEYSLNVGGPYTPLITTTSLYYMHSGLTSGTTYYYRVTANVTGCPMLPSVPVAGTVMPQYTYYYGSNGDGHSMGRTCVIKPDGVDAVPMSQNITVYAGIGQNYIFWPQEAGTNDYTLEYSMSPGGPFTNIITTSSLNYTHTGLTPGDTYYYHVTANVTGCTMNPSPAVAGTVMPQYSYYGGGNGDGHSNSVTCVIKPNGASAAPFSQPITVYAGINQNYIFWPQDASAIDYTLAVSSSPSGPFTAITTTSSLNYIHTGLTAGTTYYYIVTANVTGCPMNPSLIVAATAMGQYNFYYGGDGDGHSNGFTCVIKPDGTSAAPNSQPITTYAGLNQNYIFWPQDATAINYTLEVASNPLGPFSPIITTNSLDYIHTGLTTGTTYYYHVIANVAGCPMNPSAVDSVTAFGQYSLYYGGDGDGHSKDKTCVIKPDGNAAVPQSQNITVYAGVGQNYIFWPQEAGTNDYTLSYSMSPTGPFTNILTTSSLDYIHTGLTPGNTYYYIVTANTTGCPMNPSPVIAGTVMPQYNYYAGGNGDGHSSVQSCVFITLNATTIYVGDTTDLCIGDTVTLTASYSSNYSWSTGATTQQIDVTASGSYYVNTFNIYSCPTPSYLINLNFKQPPVFTLQPLDAGICSGLDTSFSITTTSGSAYLWYESNDNGSTWSALSDGGIYSGTSTPQLFLTGVTTSMDSFQYKCMVSACNSGISSDPAILYVYPLPSFTSSPANVSQCPGNSVTFNVASTGNNPVYAWYENQGSGWTPLTNTGVYGGVLTSALTISDVTGMDGYQYQCIVSGCSGSDTSSAATLTLNITASITADPSDVTECSGNSASFSVSSAGTSPTFAWYENQGSGWYLLNDAGIYSGTGTSTLNISDVSGMDGFQYHCIVKACNTEDTSATATLSLYQAPVINSQPLSVIKCSGGTSFSVSATGALGYQWYENQGAGWVALSDAGIYSGVNTPVLNISDVTGMNNYQYQCVVTACSYNATTSPATLAYSMVNVWLGYSTDWNNAANWACGIPDATSDVTIPASPSGGNLPLVFTNGISVCRDFNIDPGSGITLDPGSDLTVYGDWINGGPAAIGEGKVIFAGTSQTINGTTTFGHMTINNGTLVTIMSSGQKIAGILLCNGTLNTNGYLTLLSGATGTALIDGSGTGNVNGTVTLQRFVSAAKAKGYKHYATAFSNSTLGQFSNFMTLYLGSTSNSPFPTMFKYSEAVATPYFSNGWIAAAPQGQVNTIMTPAVGYTAEFGSGSSVDINSYLYGEVNNGNISINVTRLNPGSSKGDGWNLVGNPYPSPIDLDKLPYTAAKLNKSVSIFISTSMYNGYYGYYNAVFHLPLNGGTRYLSSLHAFFVQCNNTSGGTLTFSNSVRSNKLNPSVYKTEENLSFPVIRLTGKQSQENEFYDETAIIFDPNATNGNDPDYDAGKIMNTEPAMPNIYTISNSKNFAINGLPDDFENITEIPVGFSIHNSGIYEINATEILNFPAGINVYLEDKALSNLQNLNINPVYKFTADINSPAEGRFAIKFKDIANADFDNIDNEFNFAAWATDNELLVSVNGQKNSGTLQMYDALGRIIFYKTINSDGFYTFNINLPAGTYMVRYLNGENTKTTKVFTN